MRNGIGGLTCLPFGNLCGLPFTTPLCGDSGIVYPPVSEELLIWLKGNNSGTQKVDAHEDPDAENFDILQSHCPSLNGVDEFGTFDAAVTLVDDSVIAFAAYCTGTGNNYVLRSSSDSNNYVLFDKTGNRVVAKIGGVYNTFSAVNISIGDFWLVRVGDQLTVSNDSGQSETKTCGTSDIVFDIVGAGSSSLDGKIYKIHLKDDTQDILFGMAEGAGLESFGVNPAGERVNRILWSADPVTLWAQRQDTYPRNALYGWWEINGDPVKYPYPVAGFDTYHEPGIFNDCESSYAPESFPIGSPNGIDHTITMLADRGTIVSHGSLDTSTPTYLHPTITFTAGIIRDILFSDGTFLQLREGTGTDLYNSEGVLVAMLNGDPSAFWAGAPMVAESVILAEADQGSAIVTDGNGHPEPRTQTWLEDNLNANHQHYMTACNDKPELLIYKTQRSIAEDAEILIAGCKAEPLTIDGQVLTHDGAILYKEI